MNNHQFKIKSNHAGQRILIIDDDYRFSPYDDISPNDFDALFFETKLDSLLESQIMWLNPITKAHEFHYKPFFCTPTITGKLLRNFCDGVYPSIEAENFIKEVDRINKRIKDLSFEFPKFDESRWTTERLIISFLRMYLSRADQVSHPVLKMGSSFGYTHHLVEIFLKYRYFTEQEYISIIHILRTQYRFHEVVELINVVHLCPECFRSHIIYTESCPKCESPNIALENMIHHFRCANISPERSYMKEGRLICPKCNRELRHIGVDYDRPMGIYSCNKCHSTFSRSVMNCLCVSCENKFSPENLIPYSIYDTRFTPYGKTMLPKAAVFEIEDNFVPFSNFLPFKEFEAYLRNRIEIFRKYGGMTGYKIRIIRFGGEMSSEARELIADSIFVKFPGAEASFKRNIFYIFTSSMLENIDPTEIAEASLSLEGIGVERAWVDYLDYTNEIDPDVFIHQL